MSRLPRELARLKAAVYTDSTPRDSLHIHLLATQQTQKYSIAFCRSTQHCTNLTDLNKYLFHVGTVTVNLQRPYSIPHTKVHPKYSRLVPPSIQ
jgi:hypothetical protein